MTYISVNCNETEKEKQMKLEYEYVLEFQQGKLSSCGLQDIAQLMTSRNPFSES
jgi:hypothetical protein